MGVLHWYSDKNAGVQQRISRADVKSDASGAHAMLFGTPNLADASLDTIAQRLNEQGFEARFDVILPGDRPQLVINGFDGKNLTREKLVARLKKSKEHPFYNSIRIDESNPQVVIVESIKSQKLTMDLEAELEGLGYKVGKSANKETKPVIRVTWKEKGITEEAAEQKLTTFLQAHAFVTGEPIRRDREPNPLRKAQKNLSDWVNQNPARAGGILYSIGNLGQLVSGVMRGNSGEAMSGLSYLLPNADLALGPRRSRSEEVIVKDALDDFPEKDGGKRDFEKSNGFMGGSRRYGGLIGDYLNWRERPQNIMSVKSLFNIFAGYNAFRGGLSGRKALMLDEEGNVQLNEQGLPAYEYKRDAALLYDGTAAMLAYVPVATLSPRNSDFPPPVDISHLVAPVAQLPGIKQARDVFAATPPGSLADNAFKALQNDPAPTMRTLMGSRNLLHFGFALYDGVSSIPHRIEEYRTKFVIDAFRLLTPQGGERSHYAQLRELFPSVENFVDNKGQLTAEARSIKNTTIEAYESRLQERDTLRKASRKSNHTAALQELDGYLKTHGPAYEHALLLGCFDKEDRSVSKGVPFLNRHKEPGSYEKLIKRHEAKLHDPYHEIKRGGSEEQLYITALNRKFADQLEGSRNLPWVRLFYSVANLSAAWQLGRVNQAGVKPEVNNLDVYLDSFKLYDAAAKAISDKIHISSIATEQERHEALERAADHMAIKLSGERELVRAKLSKKEIRDGIVARLENRPIAAQELGQQLAVSAHQQATASPTHLP